jgi:hypothetical protein
VQASKIVINKEYAVNVRGEPEPVAFLVSEVLTVRGRNTNSFVVGYYGEPNEEGQRPAVKVSVEAVIGELDTVTALRDRKKAEEAEAKAANDARIAKFQKAAHMLATAIGVTYFEDRYGPGYSTVDKQGSVYPGGNTVQINEKALDQLIAFLEHGRVEA